jgi:hypothetical protein
MNWEFAVCQYFIHPKTQNISDLDCGVLAFISKLITYKNPAS